MAAQRLLVFESLSTEFTLYLLLDTTVLGYNVPLGVRLLYKSFPTDCAASPSIHPTGNEFLSHKTFVLFTARTDQASFVTFLLLVPTVIVAVIVSCSLFHVSKCTLL